MSVTIDDSIKRWTAKRKSALVVEIIQGKTMVAKASRAYVLSPSEIEGWVDDAKRGMDFEGTVALMGPRKPQRWRCGRTLLRDPRAIRIAAGSTGGLRRGHAGAARSKKLAALMEREDRAWLRHWSERPWRGTIRTLHEGLLSDGVAVPLTKLCAWFGAPRRTVYYKPTKAAPTVDPRFAEPIKVMMAWLLGFNKNTMQRIFQIKGWQVRKRHAASDRSGAICGRRPERALVH